MSKMPLDIELELRSLLAKMSKLVGPEYEVAFVAKNGKRHFADILLGDKDLNNLLTQRLPTELQLGPSPQTKEKGNRI